MPVFAEVPKKVPKEKLEELLTKDTQKTIDVIDHYISFLDKTYESIGRREKAAAAEEKPHFGDQRVTLLQMKSYLTKLKTALDSEEFLSLDNNGKIPFIMEANIQANRIYVNAHVFDWRYKILDAAPKVDKDYDNPEIMRNFKAYINAALSESEGMLKALKEEKKEVIQKEGVDSAKAKGMDRFIHERETVIHSLDEAKDCLRERGRAVAEAPAQVSYALDSDSEANIRYYKSKIPLNKKIMADATMLAMIGIGFIPSFGITQAASLTYFECKGLEIVADDYAVHGKLTKESIPGFAMALIPTAGLGELGIAGKTLSYIGKASGAYLMTSCGIGSLDIVVDAKDAGWSAADVEGVISNGIFMGFAFAGPRMSRKLAERSVLRDVKIKEGASILPELELETSKHFEEVVGSLKKASEARTTQLIKEAETVVKEVKANERFIEEVFGLSSKDMQQKYGENPLKTVQEENALSAKRPYITERNIDFLLNLHYWTENKLSRDVNARNYDETKSVLFLKQGDILPGFDSELGYQDISTSRELLTVNKGPSSYLFQFLEKAKGIAIRLNGEGQETIAKEIFKRFNRWYSDKLSEPSSETAKEEKTLGGFAEKGGVCRHRAAALQLALQEAGVKSRLVRGRFEEGRHAWVEVDINNNGKFDLVLDPMNKVSGVKTNVETFEPYRDKRMEINNAFELVTGRKIWIYYSNSNEFNSIWRPK